MTDDIIAAKQALRRAMTAKRDAIGIQERANAAASLAALVMSDIVFEADAVIGGYFPFRTELDVHPLLRVLAETNRVITLPVISGPKQPLLFRRYYAGEQLTLNQLGIPEPRAEAPALTPTHLLVPMLAFDDDFFRLGYGGGYYDRTLAGLRGAGRTVVAIGIGYEVQHVTSVPRNAQDQALDIVATESVVRRPKR